MDGQPDKRAGAALKTDGRETAGEHVLDHPPFQHHPYTLKIKDISSIFGCFSTTHLGSEPAGRPASVGSGVGALRCGSSPPLSATESQPGKRTGAASNTDGTARSEAQVLGSPPIFTPRADVPRGVASE